METNLAEFDSKNPNDRTVMHVLYALHLSLIHI